MDLNVFYEFLGAGFRTFMGQRNFHSPQFQLQSRVGTFEDFPFIKLFEIEKEAVKLFNKTKVQNSNDPKNKIISKYLALIDYDV